MRCLLGCLGFLLPRTTIVLLLLGSDYLQRAYQTLLWPLLGFFFMPLTTLTYAFATNDVKDDIVRHVIVVLAALFDLGVIGSGARWRRDRQRD